MNNTDRDIFFMKKALQLAKKGMSWTAPNPLVGAIIVKNDRIIGQGYHHKFGGDHAEVDALKSLKGSPDLRDATLYVTLEPCNHFGKTPPCVDAILRHNIGRVVVAHEDPNPLMAGKSIKKLRAAGVHVEVGVLAKEAEKINENFVYFHTAKRPLIAVKFATSLDGKIATSTGESQWITNEKSRMFARALRAQYQSILVGKNTVLKENPHLGSRDPRYKDPLRIILDSKLEIPSDFQVFRDERVIIATTNFAPSQKITELQERGIHVLVFKEKIGVPELLTELSKLNINSIFIEGGSEVIGSFFDSGMVNKVYTFHAPIIVGGKNAPNAIAGKGINQIAKAIKLKDIQRRYFDDDVLTWGYVDEQ